MSVEYTTLGQRVSLLENALMSDINGIAKYFYGEKFIDEECYEEVSDPSSAYSDTDKAAMLVVQIMRAVKTEPSSYYKFINFLRHDEKKYSDIKAVASTQAGQVLA